MRTKRFLSFLLLALTIMLLAACGGEKALPDGSYSVNVSLSGGSGRASVASPAEVTVENGAITVTLVWSSSNYDYMLVNGEKYLPVSLEPGSTFAFPLTELAEELPITADTTAMSTPHEIDYTLHFDTESLQVAP